MQLAIADWLLAVKVSTSFQFNATNIKWSKTQFQLQFYLSLAQLRPSLFYFCNDLTLTQLNTNQFKATLRN